ncbi:MAG: gamma carbonic anhydrase family protein [Myxococcales bacterium FL481]|nr:MAG: gamma carbonic anhydrase family protein [Myxococcales bacterium FL481]
MAVRTKVDSIAKLDAPPSNLPQLTAAVAVLRERFPRAWIDRYVGAVPTIGERVHIAPGVTVIGDVRLADDVSLWPGVVLRGDVNRVEIGARSNLQDGTVVHLGDDDPTVVGEEVVVGHRAILHGCRIEDGCLIGIASTVLDGAVVGHGSVIGASALVTAGTMIPPRSLVLGTPGRVVKTLTAADEAFYRKLAHKYVRLAHNHRLA